MTIQELIETLKKFPQDYNVVGRTFVGNSVSSGYVLHKIRVAKSQNINTVYLESFLTVIADPEE